MSVKLISQPGKLSRNLVVLSWVSFFQDASSEMLYPVLPLFLTGVLGATPAAVGLIEGVAEGLSSVLKGVFGKLADRMARRPLVAGIQPFRYCKGAHCVGGWVAVRSVLPLA